MPGHCRELPADLQKKIGPLPGGFLGYFAGRLVRQPGTRRLCPYVLPACPRNMAKWSTWHLMQVPRLADDLLLLHAQVVLTGTRLPGAAAWCSSIAMGTTSAT